MTGTVLVTGCTGYVAGHLLDALRAHAPSARVVGTASRAPERLHEGLETVHVADLRDRAAVRALIERDPPDRVFHLASRRDGSLLELLDIQAVATDHLLGVLRERSPSARVVVAGSAAEIGHCTPSDLPLSERAPCRPIDPYGVSKLAQSALCDAACLRHGQDVVRVRVFNLVGPGLPPALLPGRGVQLLLEALGKRSTEPLRFRDLGTERDYTDVRDVCRALILAMARGRAGALYHAGSGVAVSGRALIDGLLSAAAADTGILRYEESVAGPITVPIQVADASLAASELGWGPEITLDRSIHDMWRHAVEASIAPTRTAPRAGGGR